MIWALEDIAAGVQQAERLLLTAKARAEVRGGDPALWLALERVRQQHARINALAIAARNDKHDTEEEKELDLSARVSLRLAHIVEATNACAGFMNKAKARASLRSGDPALMLALERMSSEHAEIKALAIGAQHGEYVGQNPEVLE